VGVNLNIEVFKNDLPDGFNLVGDLAIDTETMGLNIHRDRLCLIQICDEAGKICLVQFLGEVYDSPVLKSILLDKNRTKIFHFGRFDIASIKYYLDIDLQNIFCTKIASRLVRTYTDSHGLKELCRELLGVQISKQQQSSDWGGVLSQDQHEYAARDVLYLHQLRDKLTLMLKREDRLDVAQKLFEFLPIRADLDLRGWSEIDIFSH
jgi:ribonuclease D